MTREPMPVTKQKKYRALTGLSYPAPKDVEAKKRGRDVPMLRAEKGDVVCDLPACSVPWLLRQKKIREVKE